jgi:hypothetical protein
MSIDEVVQQAADAKSTQWNPDRLIELLVRTEQGARAMAAARYRVLSALAGHSLYQDPLQDTATEAACALRIFEHAAQAQAAEAQILTRVLPETLDALATGTVQVTQVRAPIEHTSILDATTTRTLQASVLPKMPTQNPAATRKALSRAVLHADPQGAADRRATAVKNRQVVHHPQPDGISTPATTPTGRTSHTRDERDRHTRPRHPDPRPPRGATHPAPSPRRRVPPPSHRHHHRPDPTDTGPRPPRHPAPPERRTGGTGRIRTTRPTHRPHPRRTRRQPVAATADRTGHRHRRTGRTHPLPTHPRGTPTSVRTRQTLHLPHLGDAHAANTDLDHITAFNHHRPTHGGITVP